MSDTDIATGDFDHDGYEDAALTFRTAGGATPLVVLHGSATGLRTDAPAVPDGTGGRALASADLNGDGYADLAVGRSDMGDGGEISTFHGSADGLTTIGAPVVGRAAIPGGESGDRLGASLAAAGQGSA